MGVRKTLEKIRRRFYWPGQKSDVVKWCSNCIACNSRKSPPRNKAPLEVMPCKSTFGEDSDGYNGSPT